MRSTRRCLLFVILAVIPGGCGRGDEFGEGVPDVDCSQPVPVFADVLAFPKTCNSCHTVQIADDDPRRDAPEGMNYDVYTTAVQYAEDGAITVNEGTMPLSGGLSVRDRDDLFLWSLCGTPQ